MRQDRSEFVAIGGVRQHVRIWPAARAPVERRVLLLHGAADVSASWQFLVDALPARWELVAPDWRGHGLSDWQSCGWYPLASYLADLEGFALHYGAGEALCIVGHSLGAVVASYYAGIRPDKVERLVMLDPYPNVHQDAAGTPARYARWLDALAAPPRPPRGQPLHEFALQLCDRNPLLPQQRAVFMARHLCSGDDAAAVPRMDPARNHRDPAAWCFEDAAACWRQITAPVLWVGAGQPDPRVATLGADELRRQRSQFPDLLFHVLPHAGHLLHCEQPGECAALISAFVDAGAPA